MNYYLMRVRQQALDIEDVSKDLWRASVLHWAKAAREDGSSMEDIAEAAGLPLSEMYAWFGETMPEPTALLAVDFPEEQLGRLRKAAEWSEQPVEDFVRKAVLRALRTAEDWMAKGDAPTRMPQQRTGS